MHRTCKNLAGRTCRTLLILIATVALSGCAGIKSNTARSHILGAIVRGFMDVQDAEHYVDPCQSAGKKSLHCPRNFGSQLAVAGTSAAYREVAEKRARDERSAAYRLALLEFMEAQGTDGLAGTAEKSLVIVEPTEGPPMRIEMARNMPGMGTESEAPPYDHALASHGGL